MPAYYFDTSALVKWYVIETGTRWVGSILSAAPDVSEVHTVRIAGVEVIAALALRARTGTLTPEDARAASAQFRTDFGQAFAIAEVTASLVERAMLAAEQHGLRGYDAVHLAAALAVRDIRRANGLSPITFVSADTRLNAAAASEGLAVVDPNAHL